MHEFNKVTCESECIFDMHSDKFIESGIKIKSLCMKENISEVRNSYLFAFYIIMVFRVNSSAPLIV